MMHPVYLFLDIGGGELILIGLVALLLFGRDKLPELARGLGKGIRDFKDASEGVKREIQNQINAHDEKKAEEAKTEEPVVSEPAAAETVMAHHHDEPVTIPEPVPNHVPNTMQYGEGHVTASDDADGVAAMVEEKRAEDLKLTEHHPISAIEPNKEQHN